MATRGLFTSSTRARQARPPISRYTLVAAALVAAFQHEHSRWFSDGRSIDDRTRDKKHTVSDSFAPTLFFLEEHGSNDARPMKGTEPR